MAASTSVDLPASFERHLRAGNKSARTVETYLGTVTQLARSLRCAAAFACAAP